MAVAELKPGEQLGPAADGSYRYEVIDILGAGGFGITYLVRDQRLHGEVVIKELACSDVAYRDSATGQVRPARGQDESHRKLVERFVKEAQLLNRLRNPHIIRVTDVWEERGTAYYAMDKVDADRHLGAPDADGVTTRSWHAVAIQVGQLMDALDAVHAAGMVHGDVKPANVLLDRKRGVVLIDFGTARDDSEFGRTVTSTSFTRGYAPPELMHPSRVREAGPWSDLYSLGMVVWGLVLPHPGDGQRPVDAFARSQSFDPYADAAGQLSAAGMPAAWAEAIEECIALEPYRRPKSVQELRDRLGLPAPAELDAGASGARSVERQLNVSSSVALRATETQYTDSSGPSNGTLSGHGGAPNSRGNRYPNPAGGASAGVSGGVQGAPYGASAAGSGSRPINPPLGALHSAPPTPAPVAWSDTSPPVAQRSKTPWFAFATVLMVLAAGLAALAFYVPRGQVAPTPDPDSEASGAAELNSDGQETPPNDDPCAACSSSEMCHDGRCLPAYAAEAEAAYRASIDAWNTNDPKRYFEAFQPNVACFFNRENLSVAELRGTRGRHFAFSDGAEFVIETLEIVRADAGGVLLRDTGRFVTSDGREKPHVRMLLLTRGDDDKFRVSIEVNTAAHDCAPHLFR